MHLATPTQTEVQGTIDVVLDIVNGLDEGGIDVRRALVDAGFSRAEDASTASLRRLEVRLRDLHPVLRALPDLETGAAAALVNEQLADLPIVPSIVTHDGVDEHMHWTPSTARFDDQVLADVVMALALEICDHGTSRFGRCGASDCEDLYLDTTRNHGRRFCSDPRCASRTHTADHRARKRASSGTS